MSGWLEALTGVTNHSPTPCRKVTKRQAPADKDIVLRGQCKIYNRSPSCCVVPAEENLLRVSRAAER